MSEPITAWNVWVAEEAEEDGFAWPVEVRAPDRDSAAQLVLKTLGPGRLLVEVTPLEYGCIA